jgi:hypothetical protein
MQSITEQRRFRSVNKKKEVAGMNPPISGLSALPRWAMKKEVGTTD